MKKRGESQYAFVRTIYDQLNYTLEYISVILVLSITGLLVGIIIIGNRDIEKYTIISTSNVTTEIVTANFTSAIGSTTVNFTLVEPSNSFYVRIGNQVFVNIYLVWDGKNGASAGSSIRIRLPFPAARPEITNQPFQLGFISGIQWNLFSNVLRIIMVNVDPRSDPNSVFITGFIPPNTVVTSLLVSTASNTGTISLSGIYWTNVF